MLNKEKMRKRMKTEMKERDALMDEMISIIVPVYNVSHYLEQCIESIIHQTYKNIEIILVDDGSTDGGSKICDDYKEKDNRIKVLHQKNSGLTVTRRNGVNLACGDYIGFVDGDDWIENSMYQTLYDYIHNEKVDIVTSRGYREYQWGQGRSTLGDSIPEGKYEINEEEDYILTHVFPGIHGKREFINGAVWNKLFRARLIKDVLNGIDDHVHGYMDDTVCVVGTILRAKNIFIASDVLYHHRERKDSFTYSKNSKGLLQVNYGYLALKRMIDSSRYKEKISLNLIEFVSQATVSAYNNLFEIKDYVMPQYFFKSEKIPYHSRVLLYGAGKVGSSYWSQLKAEGKYEVLGILDKNAETYADLNMVYAVGEFRNYEFDYIIIAVKDIEMAKTIRFDMIKRGVDAEKIVWELPLPIFEYFRND